MRNVKGKEGGRYIERQVKDILKVCFCECLCVSLFVSVCGWVGCREGSGSLVY